MRPEVTTQVDEPARLVDAPDEAVFQRLLVADERDDRAVVVRVEVDVEDASARAAERRRNGIDDTSIAALREVRHGLERRHRPHPTTERVRPRRGAAAESRTPRPPLFPGGRTSAEARALHDPRHELPRLDVA